MPTDLTLGSRGILNWIVRGDGAFVGLQERMDQEFVAQPSNSRPKVQLRYSYDEGNRGLATISAPLKRPLVTLITNNRERIQLYRGDRHPTLPDTYAWAQRHNMQWDIWGRTPVEVDALSDAIERITVVMGQEAWEVGRVMIRMDNFQDAPFDSELAIYRALARGYCQAAQAVTA